MADGKRLPNFLFIGADKSGSTWLHRILAAHPQCYVPPCKDLYFFDRYFGRGLEWYASFFRDAPESATAVGELSHDYLYSELAAQRIAEVLADVRLVVFLRNPVERTFSEYLYLIRSGLTKDPLRSALQRFPEAIEHSRYSQYLDPYFKLFGRERLGIFLFDELQADPRRFARRIDTFLGIDFIDALPYEERVLPASRPRSSFLARVAKDGATFARRLGFPGLVGTLKQNRLTRFLYVEYADDERPRLSEDDRAWLWRHVADDVHRLELLLSNDLSAWYPDADRRSAPPATIESQRRPVSPAR
jgi:hypothetical protein